MMLLTRQQVGSAPAQFDFIQIHWDAAFACLVMLATSRFLACSSILSTPSAHSYIKSYIKLRLLIYMLNNYDVFLLLLSFTPSFPFFLLSVKGISMNYMCFWMKFNHLD